MEHRTVAEIKERLSEVSQLTQKERQALENDTRIGVRRLLDSWEKKQEALQHLRDKYYEMNRFERDLQSMGKNRIAGIDEAGRGPLAGPVVAACVVLKPGAVILGINDSKQLSAAKRDALFDEIVYQAESIGVGFVSAAEIDQINIYQAAKKAMLKAVRSLAAVPDHLLIDAMELPIRIPQTSLIKGDARSCSIAAASIIAKVERDRMMTDLDRRYPGYGFAEHKGYGTKMHLEAIHKLGPCREHRLTFAPLKQE